MARPTPRLALSASEQTILQAVVVSAETPERVRMRARIILMAVEGVASHRIGLGLGVSRGAVLRTRERFLKEGIRGLWDKDTPAPYERIPPEKERAILFNTLYRFPTPPVPVGFGPSLWWTVRNLAFLHRVSPATVQRIWARYGIQYGFKYRIKDRIRVNRWAGIDLAKFKISLDPLFGVRISRIVGIYYEPFGPALALSATTRPFSEFRFCDLTADARKEQIDSFIWSLWRTESCSENRGPIAKFPDRFVLFLEKLHAQREPDAEIHILTGVHRWGSYDLPDVKKWLAQHPCIKMHHAPNTIRGAQWPDLVEKWLTVINRGPVQAELMESIRQLKAILIQLSPEKVREGFAFV